VGQREESGRLALPWTKPALEELASSDNAVWRVQAAIALTNLGDPDAQAILREFIDHPDRRKRREPKTALSGLYVQAADSLGDPLETPLRERRI
jgi:HEAT repeat protein